MSVYFRVAPHEVGRIDKLLANRYPDVGRRALARLFAGCHVRVDGAVAHKGDRVSAGAEVSLRVAPDQADAVIPADDPGVVTIHVEPTLIAVAKPPGMPSHPLNPGETGTAANVLVARFADCASASPDRREAGLVHRLDTDTSGVLVAARDPATWRALRDAFTDHEVEKTYLALVCGDVAGPGQCDEPLSRTGKHVRVTAAGLPAHTRWQVVERFGTRTLLRCHTRYGRRHQVRVHLAHAGHPICGDRQYGGEDLDGADGHFLHAAAIRMRHPSRPDELHLEAPLPAQRTALLERLRVESDQRRVDQ